MSLQYFTVIQRAELLISLSVNFTQSGDELNVTTVAWTLQ
jgi:hypothetical protein